MWKFFKSKCKSLMKSLKGGTTSKSKRRSTKPMGGVAEDKYRLLTEEENKELFGMLKDIKSVLDSLPKSTEEPLPDTNESS